MLKAKKASDTKQVGLRWQTRSTRGEGGSMQEKGGNGGGNEGDNGGGNGNRGDIEM